VRTAPGCGPRRPARRCRSPSHHPGVARQPMPDVLDPQHGQPLRVGDGVAQPRMPVGDVAVQVAEEHRQVDSPAPLPGVQVEGHVVALVSGLAGGASLPPLVAVGEPDEPRAVPPLASAAPGRPTASSPHRPAGRRPGPASTSAQTGSCRPPVPDRRRRTAGPGPAPPAPGRLRPAGPPAGQAVPGHWPRSTSDHSTTHRLHMTRSASRRAAGERRRAGLESERQVLTARLHGLTYRGTILTSPSSVPPALNGWGTSLWANC
jgi:hypothetical protein